MNSDAPRSPCAWNPDGVQPASCSRPAPHVRENLDTIRDDLAAQRHIRRLAGMFTVEPELVTAFLQGIEQESQAAARQVLAAARLAAEHHPDYADLHFHAARAAVASGEMSVAAGLLSKALDIHPNYKDALILAARVALTQQRTADAKSYLHTALAAGADYPDLHMLLGAVWREEGDWARARLAYRRALELNGSLAAARCALESLPPQAHGGTNDELPA